MLEWHSIVYSVVGESHWFDTIWKGTTIMANGGSHHPHKPSKPQQEPTQPPKAETKKS